VSAYRLKLLVKCMERDIESARAWVEFFAYQGDVENEREHRKRLEECEEIQVQAMAAIMHDTPAMRQ